MLNRRQFLALTSGGMALWLGRRAFWPVEASTPARFYGACYSRDILQTTNPEVFKTRFTPRTEGELRLFNISSGEITSLPLPIFPHSITQSSRNKNWIVGVERWNTQALIFDISEKKILHKIFAPEGYYFYGHADFDKDRQVLYITGVEASSKEGYVFLFDPASGQFLEKISTEGWSPHDCYYRESKLYIANSGGQDKPSKLSVLDLMSRKFEHYDSQGHYFTHLLKIKDRWIVGASGFNGNIFPTISYLDQRAYKSQPISIDLSLLSGVINSEALSLAPFGNEKFIATLSNAPFVMECDFLDNRVRLHEAPQIFSNLSATSEGLGFASGKISGDLFKIARSSEGNLNYSLASPEFGNSVHGRFFY